MRVFVCYEANGPEIAIETGAVSTLEVFDSAEKALAWYERQVQGGLENDFVMDAEDAAVTGETLDLKVIAEEIERGYSGLTMFLGHQENWRQSYDIIAEAKAVK